MSAYPHKGIAWSQKEKSRAASRPKPNKNRISYIPQSLRGLRYFFVRQAFFFSPGLTHHQAKTNSRAHAPFGVCTFTLSGNAVFWYFLRDKPSTLQGAAVRLDFFSKFRRNGGTQRGRWQKKNMDSRPIYRGHR